ncbi:nicotinic acid mononucleotide adenyltransferase [Thecamonas trahens ATCC 50062]|uniref:Nicotinic acid mononucleotide adenyltransferase n=1 Tax=Thecamonas trahens ATCC 50062 TaxID=461836 RepID=A0A0L0DVH7_THETB|nr:nicotinic acid mononucleotide adenyltransferase [Thecamonas trahens ATCC 50062]KNC56319.1 nicotinic acid mononucleotide adenyltransferase [Thecamonas trahens ATCC 50062]|eukprot:XP_013760836.1 nicotinic acid mononucleotide adenyltransferase [Thecamonas trahens ATCC 50062]
MSSEQQASASSVESESGGSMCGYKREYSIEVPASSSSSSSSRVKVAVYGGSFDPITDAHLKVMAECIHSGKADEVWVVPCANRRDKPLVASALDRLIMAHQAVNTTFGSRFPVYVKDMDVFNETATPTYYLMKQLTKEVPGNDFYFVLGSDLLPGLRKWDMGEELASEFNFLIMERPGYPICKENMPAHYELLSRPEFTMTITKLSSSEVRKRIRKNVSLVDGLIPSSVLAHIIRNHLYKCSLPQQSNRLPLSVTTPISVHPVPDLPDDDSSQSTAACTPESSPRPADA